ncbi:FecR family protein [Paraglaciecola sp.]|uniref:FecR family protein n=1 Tax=Paraglaciecola sp. TaxID=1920173 RepID=UPI00273E53BA|nr:FecR domain-containing protein [Paraglaciecola sp.]MDP5032461.1 FecR domain-containing protein [Paraglaciecola sp.]
MTNIKTFNSKETIQQQASEWISRIDRGLRADEHKAFKNWVNSSESHRQILFDMAQTWDDMSALNELKDLMPLNKLAAGPQKPYRSPRLALAASVAFVMFSVLSFLMFKPSQLNGNDALAHQLMTHVGEQKPVTLDDGSVVYLNTNSELSVHFTEQTRHITLIRGEALFEVAHDTARPFIVSAAGNTVTAVGTAFNMQLLDEQRFELLVTEGKVLLKNEMTSHADASDEVLDPLATQHGGLLLVAGQKALVAENSAQEHDLSIEQIQNELAWRQGIVVFHGEPLVKALNEISRYMPVNFNFDNEKLKEKRVAGYFKAGDLDGLLAALNNNFNIQYKKVNDNTILLFSDI